MCGLECLINSMSVENHTMSYVGSDIKDNLVSIPYYGQCWHSPDQTAQGPIQPSLE